LKQVIPSVKNLGSPSGAADVEVEVRIDDSGHVTQARVMKNRSNNEFLSSAALTAAKEWIFEPAKMYGKGVISDHTIIFHFQPQMEQQ
jgi:TonB family protein